MKRILVTNDDGISTSGISALADAMEGLGEVWVVAPDREMSAISHALTLMKPLRVAEIRDRWFAVNGTPTDCVYLALTKLVQKKVDLVVSGINNGANLGEDVHYSGTVAGAVEGMLLGVPGVAFSQVGGFDQDLQETARFATRLADAILNNSKDPKLLINVNLPRPPFKGVRLTKLGNRHYEQSVKTKRDSQGNKYYLIGGAEIRYERQPFTDCHEIQDGYITVTPLHLDLTNSDAFVELSSWRLFRES